MLRGVQRGLNRRDGSRRYARYAIAIAAVLVAFGLTQAIDAVPAGGGAFLFFFPAVIASAWVGGLGPGILATLLSCLLIDYYFLTPAQSLAGRSAADHFWLGIFVLEGVVLSGLCEAYRRATRSAPPNRLGGASGTFERAILDSSLDCIVTMDADGRIVEFNPAAERTFGYRREQVLGRMVSEVLIPPRLREAHQLGLARFHETGHGPVLGRRLEMPATCADGSEIPVELSIVQARLADGTDLFNAYIRDITPWKRAEDERANLLERERAARAEAEQANRIKDEFLATISHELRTPLNAILGWTQLLRGGRLDNDASARALQTIEQNARSQARLIDDVLDLSRIVSGKMRLELRATRLVPVIEAAVNTVRPAAEAKGITIISQLDAAVGPVAGDPTRLQQVVWNLLSNAVKFTPRGGEVHVDLSRDASSVRIAVRDSGIGIRRSFLPHIFDAFRQADGSSTRPHSGLGLGLAIVRHLVDLHGGTVDAESSGEGMGTTMTIRLPLAAVHWPDDSARAGPFPAARATAPDQTFASLRGLRILVVDDDPNARELLNTMLSQSGAEVTTAASAGEGLNVVRQSKPDVLISDIEMPGQDGYSLIRSVRALRPEDGGCTPAAALTAYAGPDDRHRALSAGFQRHIAKPVDPINLAAAIANLAGRDASS